MFKAPFSFSGRITRSEYLATGLILFFAGLFGSILMDIGGGGTFFGCITILAACWIGLAQGWKRSHDAGWTGFIALIPYVNILLLLFAKGDAGTNKYGPNPRLNGSQPPPQPRQATYTPPPLPSAWERARQSDEPKFKTISFKCGACGAKK